jgi:uracil-DNA glycosylase
MWFLFCGALLRKKASLIDETKHFIIQSAHPSPFSVYRGFYGSRPFSKINDYLKLKGKKPLIGSLLLLNQLHIFLLNRQS